ncbi:MAG: hypothetical protein JSS21_03985 [Proteobacteria bacterium]|nr:hypothetical protein [Pseudomonadota bacterium]
MPDTRIALVTARAARDLDEDLPPLQHALREAGADTTLAEWDDPAVEWTRFDLALLRSTWDYSERLSEFLGWAARAAHDALLLNPVEVVRWNTDKHYLAQLSRAGVPVVPGTFVEPGETAESALAAFLQTHPDAEDFVVKPSVGAGSRDAQRHGRGERIAATAHIDRLLGARRSVLLQPYLPGVDTDGETALLFFDGEFSHAIRKGPLLLRNAEATRALFAAEHIVPRQAATDEIEVARRALAALPFATPLLYARVDLIRDDAGAPRLLELELTEPSVFLAHAAGAAERFAKAILRRIPA